MFVLQALYQTEPSPQYNFNHFNNYLESTQEHWSVRSVNIKRTLIQIISQLCNLMLGLLSSGLHF